MEGVVALARETVVILAVEWFMASDVSVDAEIRISDDAMFLLGRVTIEVRGHEGKIQEKWTMASGRPCEKPRGWTLKLACIVCGGNGQRVSEGRK